LFRTAGILLIVALAIDLLLRATTSSEVDDGLLLVVMRSPLFLWCAFRCSLTAASAHSRNA